MNATKFAKGVKLKEIELLLLEDPLALLSCFKLVDASEIDSVGGAIAEIYFIHRRSADLLKLCASQEIYTTPRPEELLRQDNIRIVILQDFLRRRGQRWLYKTLRKPLRKIIQSDATVEIDKMRLSTNEDITINTKNLKDAVNSVLNPIFDNVEGIPEEIGGLCKLLYSLTTEKFHNDGYAVLSCSFFLRFVCPFIGSPKFWHCLTKTEIKPDIRRKLVLIAKVIQGIANEITEFNEPYMNILDSFVKRHISHLHKFYDKLTEVSPNIQNTTWNITKKMKGSLPESQNNIYQFFYQNYSRISVEIIDPLVQVYSGAEMFKQRLQVLFWDEIPQIRANINNSRVLVRRELNERLKTLREGKTHGEQIWGILFAGLRHVIGDNLLNGNFTDVGTFNKGKNYISKKRSADIGKPGHRNSMNCESELERNPAFKHRFPMVHEWNSMSDISVQMHMNDLDNTDISDAVSSDDEFDSNLPENHPIYTWLQELGFEEYFDIFIQHSVCTMEVLRGCSERDLLEFGITQPHARNKLLNAIADDLAAQSISTTASPTPKKRKSKRKQSAVELPRRRVSVVTFEANNGDSSPGAESKSRAKMD